MKPDSTALTPGELRQAQERDSLEALYARIGFKIRRAHQITISLYEDHGGGVLTQTQFGVMLTLRHRPDIDQITLAKMIGHDRSTIAMVVSKLERSGYIHRRAHPEDGRRKLLALTPEGNDLVFRHVIVGMAVENELMSVFSQQEADELNRLLSKLVNAFNHKIRTPIGPDTNGGAADGA